MDTTPQIVRELPPDFKLKHGSHSSFADGACLMEAVSYVAGLPHSDEPECTSRVLTRIAIRLNDRWSDEERQLLAPLIPRLVGTRTSMAHDTKRAYVFVDAAIRTIAPMGLDAVGWRDLGARLREMAPVVDRASARAARVTCEEVRDEARKRRAAAYAADAYADADADADAAAYAAYAADYAAYAADYAAYAAAYAAYAADYAAAAADYAAAERAKARRPIIEATVRAFELAISTPE